jgi:hypothetical protein
MLSGVRMHARFAFAVALAALCILPAVTARAQSADAGTTAAAPGSADAGTAKAKKKSTKKKSKKAKKAPPPAPAQSDIDEETRKALEAAQPPPVAPAPTVVHEAPPPEAPAFTPPPPAEAPVVAAPPAEAPPPEVYTGPPDNDPPTLNHTPVVKAPRGKPLVITAHAVDPSGIFGPVLYVRKKGLDNTEFIPLRMTATRGKPGDYQVELAPALTSVEAIEYYVEVYDNAGNGPVRSGSPETPLTVTLEEEKKAAAAPIPVVRPKGAPPAITHTAVTQATKNTAIEINARLVGDTGVSSPTVMFRRVGEKDYKALPMGNIGGDDYTATVPAQMATGDIEYYVEAFDKYQNGPGRSGAPAVPYIIKVVAPEAGAFATGSGHDVHQGPRIVKAPFRANPGRALGWLAMAGFVGGAIFAGGEALAASNANSEYQHTFTFEGRDDKSMLAKANADGSRAKTALLVAGPALVVGIVLLIVFPEHPDTMVVGGGGDIGVRF